MQEPKFTYKDYLFTALVIAAVLTVWLVAVGFGRPPYAPASYISEVVYNLYSFVIVAAGVVASIFIGAMIYFVYKFREGDHGEGQGS